MRFLIFTFGQPHDLANMLINTIHYHHKDAEIVHLTDMDTPQLKDSDSVWRLPKDNQSVMILRWDHLSRMDAKPSISLDVDVLIRRNLGSVFEDEFDVALTKRRIETDNQPYNTGIMFARDNRFFKACREKMEREPRFKQWIIEQEGVGIEARSGRWDVKELPMDEWNHAPGVKSIFPESRILHYKGPRKDFMRDHFKRGIWK